MIGAVLIDAAVVLAICTLGALISFLVIKNPSRLEWLSLSFPLGAAALTWSLFILGWLGISFRLEIVFFVWLISIGVITVLIRRSQISAQAKRLLDPVSSNQKVTWLEKTLFAVLAIIFFISIFISIGRSYSAYDAVAMWAPKGYGIAIEESLWGAHWGGHGFSYPLNMQFLIGIFKLASDDILPGSKIIFPLFFISLIAGVAAFLNKQGVEPRITAFSAVILATVPTIFHHSTIGYANLPMGVYLVLGVLWGIDGIYRESQVSQVLSGLLLGFAVWTIIEGVLFVFVAVLAIVCAKIITRRGRIYLIHWFLPIIVIGGIWLIFYKLYAASGSAASGAARIMLDSILNGEWDFPALRLIFGYARRNIFDPHTWGLLYPLGIIITLFGWKHLLPNKDRYVFSIFLVMLSTGLLALGLIYLRSFVIPGLYDLLKRGFPRYFISPSIFYFLVVILIGGKLISEYSKNDIEEPAE